METETPNLPAPLEVKNFIGGCIVATNDFVLYVPTATTLKDWAILAGWFGIESVFFFNPAHLLVNQDVKEQA